MSLLDDAEILLNEMDPTIQGLCLFCYGTEDRPGEKSARTQHKPGCVYLRRNRIIAALEAAAALVSAATGGSHPVGGEGPMPFREWQALVTALKEPA